MSDFSPQIAPKRTLSPIAIYRGMGLLLLVLVLVLSVAALVKYLLFK
jgi:hypothetical protein